MEERSFVYLAVFLFWGRGVPVDVFQVDCFEYPKYFSFF